jgi:hypothetical protein
MEERNFNSLHIISEAIIVGGLSIYVFKRISELESTVDELKQQITMQNNQLRYLLGSTNSDFGQRGTTPLRMSTTVSSEKSSSSMVFDPNHLEDNENIKGSQSEWFTSSPNKSKMECKGGVCTLARDKIGQEADKKVVISKISKQIEFDIDAPVGRVNGSNGLERENNDFDQFSKINTFTKFSPNPVLKSVTPKPSLTIENDHGNEEINDLDNILNEIDNE